MPLIDYHIRAWLLLIAILYVSGCSRPSTPPTVDAAKHVIGQPKPSSPKPLKHHPLAQEHPFANLANEGAASQPSDDFPPLAAPADSPPSTAEESSTPGHAVAQSETFPTAALDNRSLREIDEYRASAAGVRKLSSKHLVLFTDLPDPSVDELPAVFDAAFPLWCRHLGLDAAANADWQVRGYLIGERERFEAAGLCPADLPQFLNGYTRGREIWLYNQSSEYYRRHLLLHEGVHGIMFSLQRSNGPAWYMEGVAELLATHRWVDGRLELPYFPMRAADVPKLGRIEIVQTQFQRGQGMHLASVLAFENRAYLQNEPYAWSWAAVAFLYGHPAYRDRFRALMKQPAYGDFNDVLKVTYAADASALSEEWQVFVGELAHGYDFERMQLDLSKARETVKAGIPAKLKVVADRGWQNAALRLEAGRRYKLTATGQFTLATEPKPWISEPAGVTIRYHHGLPLGILLAVVRPDDASQGPPPFYRPQVIGAAGTIEPKYTGTLYLRLNDFAGELADNRGGADVVIAAE